MKVEELLEYKNKYYKRIGPKPKPRPKKTLWYNDYESWVADVKTRFPDAQAFYDEENEEIIASCPGCKDSYGKWSNKADGLKGVTFKGPRNIRSVSRNFDRLKRIEDKKKQEKTDKAREIGDTYSALL